MNKILLLLTLLLTSHAEENPFTIKQYSQKDLFIKAQEELKDKNFKDSYETLKLCEDYIHCQTMLGFFYTNAIYVSINESKAISYFKKAIDKNSTESMYNLGSLYLKNKNYTEAIKYLEMASSNNNNVSNYNLGLIYLYGWGVKPDYEKSLKYMLEAQKLDYKQADAPVEWLKEEIKKQK